jgi:putative intracellular protease/amidase
MRTRLRLAGQPCPEEDRRGSLPRAVAPDRDRHRQGSQLTSYKSIKTDVTNAGAKWEDSEVVVDDGVITSRNPGDLDAFSVIEAVKEGKHSRRSAA